MSTATATATTTTTAASRERLVLTEVGPRDGLQSLSGFVPTRAKLALIEALASAGLRSIEATSFVSPNAVPQMADAAQVLAGTQAIGGLRASVLVPNRRGLERARLAGAREVAVVVAATDTMNRRNINMALDAALDEGMATLEEARAHGMATRAYVAVAFECPFEGPVAPAAALRVAAGMLTAGAGEIVIADTIGAAGPLQVRELFAEASGVVSTDRLAAHFHDTRGLGAANAWAALEAGVRRFDASVGGLGGCPFAPGAAGNLATEDLVLLAEQAGFCTGVDVAALVAAVGLAQDITGRPLGGRSMAWYRRQAGAASTAGPDKAAA